MKTNNDYFNGVFDVTPLTEKFTSVTSISLTDQGGVIHESNWKIWQSLFDLQLKDRQSKLYIARIFYWSRRWYQR